MKNFNNSIMNQLAIAQNQKEIQQNKANAKSIPQNNIPTENMQGKIKKYVSEVNSKDTFKKAEEFMKDAVPEQQSLLKRIFKG